MSTIALSDEEFGRFQRFILDAAGITLTASKKALVCGRLGRRLQHHRLASYGDYLRLLLGPDGADEMQQAIDLLTTNETYFFREPRHFELLARLARERRDDGTPLRVWSAACSSGEEVYSIAMVLDEVLGGAPWEVLGTDISSRVLEQARSGHYDEARARGLGEAQRKRHCLRGTGTQRGTFLIRRALRERTRFAQVNLNASLPPRLGRFDAIFLRNVMIYFDGDTKRRVIERVLAALKPGGHFFIGHAESLGPLDLRLQPAAPSVYRKP